MTSPIRAELDFAATGRTAGQLRVPSSRNDHGWGTIAIPVVQVANGTGPTILFTAGNHGDEYEGQVALLNLARTLDPASVQGRVIIIPALHYPAALAGARLSPLDNRDFNRSFPGDPRGSFAQVLAHFVDTVLLPLCDAQMDLHSGGTGMEMVPSAVGHLLPDKDYQAKCVAMADAFAAPLTLLLEEVNAGPTLLAAAEARGIVALSAELGGAGRLGHEALAVTERGVRGVLHHLGIVGEAPPPAPPSLHVVVPDLDHYVFAPHDAIWQAADPIGATVQAGAAAGWLHRIEAPLDPPLMLAYRASGTLWCSRAPGRCRAGDPVSVVCRPM